jgi:hypothetical protein
MRGVTIVPGAVAVMLAAAVPAFEPAPTFQASKILPANLLKGPHHTVSEEVKAEGLYQVFEIVSDFGDIVAEGRTVLRTRVREIDALARLSEVSKGEIFAKAAGGAVLNVGKGVASVVKDPEGTRPSWPRGPSGSWARPSWKCRSAARPPWPRRRVYVPRAGR